MTDGKQGERGRPMWQSFGQESKGQEMIKPAGPDSGYLAQGASLEYTPLAPLKPLRAPLISTLQPPACCCPATWAISAHRGISDSSVKAPQLVYDCC